MRSDELGHLSDRSPLEPFPQEDRELRRVEGCFLDGGKLLSTRLQDPI